MTHAPQKKRRLGEILMEAGLLSELQLRSALAEQRKWGGKLGRTLVKMGFVDEQSMVLALSRQLHVPAVELDKMSIPEDVLGLVKADVAERYGIIPIGGDRRHKTMQIATSDPTNMDALQELAFSTGMRIQAAVASENAIERAIRRYYYGESVTSSSTAAPAAVGVGEVELDEDIITNSGNALVEIRSTAGTRAPGQTSPGVAASDDASMLKERLSELTTKVAELEKVMAGQVRAMRGILELLLEKRLLSRDEYLAKVRPQGK